MALLGDIGVHGFSILNNTVLGQCRLRVYSHRSKVLDKLRAYSRRLPVSLGTSICRGNGAIPSWSFGLIECLVGIRGQLIRSFLKCTAGNAVTILIFSNL